MATAVSHFKTLTWPERIEYGQYAGYKLAQKLPNVIVDTRVPYHILRFLDVDKIDEIIALNDDNDKTMEDVFSIYNKTVNHEQYAILIHIDRNDKIDDVNPIGKLHPMFWHTYYYKIIDRHVKLEFKKIKSISVYDSPLLATFTDMIRAHFKNSLDNSNEIEFKITSAEEPEGHIIRVGFISGFFQPTTLDEDQLMQHMFETLTNSDTPASVKYLLQRELSVWTGADCEHCSFHDYVSILTSHSIHKNKYAYQQFASILAGKEMPVVNIDFTKTRSYDPPFPTCDTFTLMHVLPRKRSIYDIFKGTNVTLQTQIKKASYLLMLQRSRHAQSSGPFKENMINTEWIRYLYGLISTSNIGDALIIHKRFDPYIKLTQTHYHPFALG